MFNQVKALLLAILVIAGTEKAVAVDLSGEVVTSGGTPICALVLASGKNMFSCDPSGPFKLTGLPTEPDGTIKLQVYADGFLPNVTTLTDFGYQTVVMTRAVDDGLSDLSPLDGTYTLLRTTLQYNDGRILDTYSDNVSATGTMTVAGDAITQTLTLTVNGQPVSLGFNGTFQDFTAGIAIDQRGVFLPINVMLIERGEKVVTSLNGNYLGYPVAEVDQWKKVSGDPSIQAMSVEDGNYLPSNSVPGGLLLELLETYGLGQNMPRRLEPSHESR